MARRAASALVALLLACIATASAAAASAPANTTTPTAKPLDQAAATAAAAAALRSSSNPALVALREGGPEALGVGLSITAALISFHVGALAVLERLGVVDLARSPLAGGSGGSVVAFCACAGLSIAETAAVVEDLSLYCSAHDSCAGTMDVAVRAGLKKGLALAVQKARREGAPEAKPAAKGGPPPTDAQVADALVDRRCRGRVQFAVSELMTQAGGAPAGGADASSTRRRERTETSGKAGPAAREQGGGASSANATATAAAASAAKSAAAAKAAADAEYLLTHPSVPLAKGAKALPWKPWLVGDYADAGEALDVAAASAFISYWSGPSNSLPFRSTRIADALFTDPLPCPEGIPGVMHCLRISAALPDTSLLPMTPPLSDADIAPFLRVPELPGGVSVSAWQRRAILAGDRAASRALARLGEMEAEAWAAEVGLLPRPAEAGGGRKAPTGAVAADDAQALLLAEEAARAAVAGSPLLRRGFAAANVGAPTAGGGKAAVANSAIAGRVAAASISSNNGNSSSRA